MKIIYLLHKPYFLIALLSFLLVIGSCKKKDNSIKTELVEFKNDGWNSPDVLAFQAGFLANEGAAVLLGPINATFKLKKVMFMFGGSGTLSTSGTLRIYKDVGTIVPGELLHESDFSIMSSDDNLRILDLSSKNLRWENVNNIRVMILFKKAGLPCIARDSDGTITSGRNFVLLNGSWGSAELQGITGDWIIRAEVEKEK